MAVLGSCARPPAQPAQALLAQATGLTRPLTRHPGCLCRLRCALRSTRVQVQPRQLQQRGPLQRRGGVRPRGPRAGVCRGQRRQRRPCVLPAHGGLHCVDGGGQATHLPGASVLAGEVPWRGPGGGGGAEGGGESRTVCAGVYSVESLERRLSSVRAGGQGCPGLPHAAVAWFALIGRARQVASARSRAAVSAVPCDV